MSIKFIIPITESGEVDGGFGKAYKVAVGTFDNGTINDWQEVVVDWRTSHDAGTHGSHHARIVKFLLEHEITHVLTGHMGESMQNTITKMHLQLRLDLAGDARTAVQVALAA